MCSRRGHIDFLQVRNGAVHILDYKPDARTNRPFAQLTIYALALTRLAGLRLFDIKCAWFNEDQYCEFFPAHGARPYELRLTRGAKRKLALAPGAPAARCRAGTPLGRFPQFSFAPPLGRRAARITRPGATAPSCNLAAVGPPSRRLALTERVGLGRHQNGRYPAFVQALRGIRITGLEQGPALEPREAVCAPFVAADAVMGEEQAVRIIAFFDSRQTDRNSTPNRTVSS